MNCVFCDIVKGKIKAKIIAENANAIAFLDVKPMSDGHTIVIPKNHYRDLSSCSTSDLVDVMKLVQEVAQTISDSKLKPWGFNYLSNEGSIAGQEVMHFHVHIIPKYAKHAGLKLSLGSQNLNTIDNVYNDIKNVKKKGSF